MSSLLSFLLIGFVGLLLARVLSNRSAPIGTPANTLYGLGVQRELDDILVREGGDDLDSIDSRWRPFRPLSPPATIHPHLQATRQLADACLDDWYLKGEIGCTIEELGEEGELDAVWLWVNGSDPRWRASMEEWQEKEGIYSPEHHFREQNELLYSMRSLFYALQGHVRRLHLVTADFPVGKDDFRLIPQSVVERLSSGHTNASQHIADYWRIAQTPTWLDFSRLGRVNGEAHPDSDGTPAHPRVMYASHTELFSDRESRSNPEAGQDQQGDSLPTFNSMAIESRLAWLPGLAETSLALNDDFFLLKSHAVSDFHSPLYGAVLRFDAGYLQQVKPRADKTRINDAGEVGSLYYANYLLSKRFPRKLRPYLAHTPKVMRRSLLSEASIMFADEFRESSKRRFREVFLGKGDIQMQWLAASLMVERWREALLWTFVVAKVGSTSEVWDGSARLHLRDILQLDSQSHNTHEETIITVERGVRETLDPDKVKQIYRQTGWGRPQQTTMLFSSMDGTLPPIQRPGQAVNHDCTLHLEQCFGPFWSQGHDVRAEDIFTRITFQYPNCGDCLITALVKASGPLGLSAFFPSSSSTYQFGVNGRRECQASNIDSPPHLSLAPTWQQGNFSLATVMNATTRCNRRVNLRHFSMRLLSRYQYMSGQSPARFFMLSKLVQAQRVFDEIDRDVEASAVGINDDIVEDYEEVRSLFTSWMARRWPDRTFWEREPAHEGHEDSIPAQASPIFH